MQVRDHVLHPGVGNPETAACTRKCRIGPEWSELRSNQDLSVAILCWYFMFLVTFPVLWKHFAENIRWG